MSDVEEMDLDKEEYLLASQMIENKLAMRLRSVKRPLKTQAKQPQLKQPNQQEEEKRKSQQKQQRRIVSVRVFIAGNTVLRALCNVQSVHSGATWPAQACPRRFFAVWSYRQRKWAGPTGPA